MPANNIQNPSDYGSATKPINQPVFNANLKKTDRTFDFLVDP